MRGKRILILGGGRYNVPSIRAAQKAGFLTFVADRNAEAPGLRIADHAFAIDVNDLDSLVDAVKENKGVDGVVAMAEAGVRAAAQISARLGLPSISENAAENATSKALMRRLWRQIGTYSPEFRIATTLNEAEYAAAELAPFPLMFKPDRSFGGSRGVTRIERSEEVSAAFAAAKAGAIGNSDVVVERCVEGTEHSCEVLIWKGKSSLLCVGQKIKSTPPYRVDVSVQYPAQLTLTQLKIVADMCQRAVTALGLTQGLAHIEFGYSAGGPVLFELGARAGGGHTPEIAHHVSAVNEFVEACRMACGIPPIQIAPMGHRGADYRFLIFPPGVVESVKMAPYLTDDPAVLDVGLTVRPGDTIRPLQSTSDRAGFVVTIADTREEAMERADRACRGIALQYLDGTTHHPLDLVQFREVAAS